MTDGSLGAFAVVGICGSLRKGSFNRALLNAAQGLAPAGMVIETIEIGALPFFNADLEVEGDPPAVAAFKRQIETADGVLIATPEYNDGVPGVLTNAIDWASRLPGRAPLTLKPVALMGASLSQVGTARAQAHLRQMLSHANARTLPPPELLVALAQSKFDANLALIDPGTTTVLTLLLQRFARWILRERAAREAEASFTQAGIERRRGAA
ncbi:MAG TPA: NAD(P)H-dependent oxidoreductase [Gemmatimonadaceae bacterium]|jgi:chromate reductase|nr:NAD(P)H-dependent oxidoreductase [Gemmatimonadaceae bacterium]